MQIWLESNLQAHSFIEASYWEKNYEAVKEMLPHAEIYVCIDKSTEQIAGFIGLYDRSEEDYIEGIFVKSTARSKGIGKFMLDHVKGRKKKSPRRPFIKKTGGQCSFICGRALRSNRSR